MALNSSTACLLIFLLLLTYSLSGGMMVEGISGSMNKLHLVNKDGLQVNSRKLLVHHTILDYDYAGPNPKHDPRKGKPGIGGKNP
ncbi:uncharacterized protein LOC124932325 [Impatiens glandulifera]|uniref:uncharacterized protein LOC124932325 n=1 Tax=Impatiens glandulifera TaxID=253017 RepID=UPI001FB0C79A|nr:uncharacterized protein LOC124932325 [Impatiens glandulifera]